MTDQTTTTPRRLFVSCSGASSYTPIAYRPLGDPAGEPSDPTPFIQVARLHELQARGVKPHEVRILTTPYARQRNVERGEQSRAESHPVVEYRGLAAELADLGFNPADSLPHIPNGEKAEELWAIFETILKDVQEGDEVYVDVTHGFRSLSIVLVTALQFALRAKKARLVEVSYGAFEAVKPANSTEPRPTFDLTPFFVLNDWTDAVAVFRESRDLRPLARLAARSASDIQRRERQAAPRTLKPLAGTLKDLADTLAQTRLKSIAQDADKCRSALLAAEADLASRDETKPIRHLLHEVADALLPLSGGDDPIWRETRAGYAAAQWWLAGNSLHAAATLLRESLVSALEAQLTRGGHSATRKQADSMLGGWSQGDKCNPAMMSPGSPDLLLALQKQVPAQTWQDMGKLLGQLVAVRNALDHAFTLGGPNDPRKQLAEVAEALAAHFETAFGVPLVWSPALPAA